MRSAPVWMLPLLTACTVPAMLPDAGTDAGVDAGTPLGLIDAGRCSRPTDCVPPDPRFSCEGSSGTPVSSCFGTRCIWECGAARDCFLDAGCVQCEGSAQCRAFGCPEQYLCGFTVSQSSCGRFVPEGSRWLAWQNQFCGEEFYDPPDSGVVHDLGAALPMGDGGYATFPWLGWYCFIETLSTSPRRVRYFCPDCSFVAEWCD